MNKILYDPTIVSGAGTEPLKLKEGAYSLSEPVQSDFEAPVTGESISWNSILSIKGYLDQYTDQEVDLEKSVLETTLNYTVKSHFLPTDLVKKRQILLDCFFQAAKGI